MKTAAIQKLRSKLGSDSPVYGLWVTLEAPSITEMAVALGIDWVVIDAEHGHLDWKEIVEHVRATVRSDTVALVRIAELNGGAVKRALDVGADGVVVPWVESAEQLRQAVAFARYPPEGVRGIGAERATAWGQSLVEHTAEANDHVLVVPIIETVRTAREVPRMAQVEGVELFLFGPADYSSTAGFRGQWEGPGVAEQLLAMKDVLRQAGKHCGLLATGNEDLLRRAEQGFRMLGLGLDAGLLLRSLRGALAAVGQDRPLTASLSAREATPPPNPLPAAERGSKNPHPPAPSPTLVRGGAGALLLPLSASGRGLGGGVLSQTLTPAPTTARKSALDRPPESMRPDRPEVMNSVGAGVKMEISRGVSFECLVGSHNRARNLTTGLVTFAPGAELPYHTHTFSESITLLRGRAAVEVAGRRYELALLDNVVIPPSKPHCAVNLAANEPALFHIAMATDSPTRTLVHSSFVRRVMLPMAGGQQGAERVNRFATATRFEAGPNTEFIDFFNHELLPGLEMSGGYGRFRPGGRLPAHVHDFDESIAIIEGEASCVVEGRRFALSGSATALVPRGRVHYFRNDTDDPMAMLWVYAGPMPERIIVAESCATIEGNPWR